MPTELPLGKWQDLSLDLLGPMPTGEYLLVVIDYYSRYYEVEIFMSITASQIISRLEKIFAVHGLPVTIMSDNGQQFRSEEFEHYLVDNGILHRKSYATMGTIKWLSGAPEPKPTQEHEDCTSRRKTLEERACSLPCNIQNNSSHCHRSFPRGVIVWSENTHKDA